MCGILCMFFCLQGLQLIRDFSMFLTQLNFIVADLSCIILLSEVLVADGNNVCGGNFSMTAFFLLLTIK